jgi:hypothetical protein
VAHPETAQPGCLSETMQSVYHPGILTCMASLTAAENEAQSLTARWGIVYVIRSGPGQFSAISERRYNERGLEDEIIRVYEAEPQTRHTPPLRPALGR